MGRWYGVTSNYELQPIVWNVENFPLPNGMNRDSEKLFAHSRKQNFPTLCEHCTQPWFAND